MRVSLQIDGDSSGAVKAAQDTSAAVGDLGKQTEAISHAIEDGFKNAISSIDKFKQNAQSAGAANDNGANSALKFADRINQVAQAATGADSALSKGTAGAISFAKGVGDLFKTVGTANVVGAAIGLAINAAQTLYSVINTGGGEANRRLEEQARLVGIVKDAFSGAADKAEEFYQKNSKIVQLQAQQALIDAEAEVKRQVVSIAGRNSFQPRFVEPFGGEASIGFDQQASSAAAFQKQIDDLFASYQRGAIAADTFRNEVAAIGLAAQASDPKLAEQAAAVLKWSESLSDAVERSEKLRAVIRISRGEGTDEDLKKVGAAAASASSQFERLTNSMERQAAAQEAEARAAGKSVGEAARLRAELVLTEAAQQSGITVAGEYADKIDAIAKRYGEAAQKAGLAKLQSDAFFDRAQLGRTADDAALAGQLRNVFGDNADLNSGIANTIRANNEMKELKATTQDLASGAISDLRQQVNALGFTWQAAGNVAVHALDRIIDKLASKALDAQLAKIFGLLGGGVPGLNSDGSIAGAVGPTSVGGAPLVGFDSGGWTGTGGKYQVAGVVHREEFVFDQDATRRIGPDNLERLRRGGLPGYAGGGLVGGPASWGDISSGSAAAPAAVPVRIVVETTVSKNGELQSYVKSVSTDAASQTLTNYLGSEAAIANHAQAHAAAKSRVMV